MRIWFSVRLTLGWAASVILAAIGAGCGGGVTPAPGANPATSQNFDPANYVRQQIASGAFIQACRDESAGRFGCMALGLRDFTRAVHSQSRWGTTVAGYGPSQLQAAYNLTSETKASHGGTVVIVDAYGYPTLAKDLKTYRRHFNLPNCDLKSGCFRILNQGGEPSPLPAPPPDSDLGWLGEQALDVDMVSANCPRCRIVMIQAASNFSFDLFKAVRTGAKLHPSAISNSWGGREVGAERDAQATWFNHPGIAITASSGDAGYGVIFPSTSNTVVAVGGTTLRPSNTKRGYTEVVWGGSGSGCSEYIRVPKWQRSIEKSRGGCSKRLVADVAYDADPTTGVAAYESYSFDGEQPGWQVWGGTSVGAPAIAAIYALSGDRDEYPAALAYSDRKRLHDVRSGRNGFCQPAYLCKGEPGYDGPTGNGTPNGPGAF
jgi:subtilase family serine protease